MAELCTLARQYRKALVAAATAGLTAAQTALPMSPTAHGWVAVSIAVLGVVGVTAVRNELPAAGPGQGGDTHAPE